MPAVRHVCLLGLHDDEREAITQCLREARAGAPLYAVAARLEAGDLVVANASHPPSVQLVMATDRLSTTLFVGAAAPPGAVACISRPIDTGHLMRELDFLVGQPKGLSAARLQATAGSRWKGEHDRRRHGQPAPTAPPLPEAAACTALLVDDSETALRFLETRLQRWGLVMDRASNSGHAIELLGKRNYDFVFLDLELGRASPLDGLALCQHIKRHQDLLSGLTSSVFMVSAYHSEMDRVRGTLAGCDGYLGKPLDDAQLQRLLVHHGLRLRGQPDQSSA